MADELYHFNKNHDKLGRFASSTGGRSKYEKVSGGNREELEKAKKKIDKKRLFETKKGYIDRRIRETYKAYDEYVDTSRVKDRSEKKKIEERLFKEVDYKSIKDHSSDEAHHVTNVDVALRKKLFAGETYTKAFLNLVDKSYLDTNSGSGKPQYKNHKAETLAGILNENGYENSKSGRKYVENMLRDDYKELYDYGKYYRNSRKNTQ